MNRYTNWNVTDPGYDGQKDPFGGRRNDSGYDENMSDQSDMEDDDGNGSEQ